MAITSRLCFYTVWILQYFARKIKRSDLVACFASGAPIWPRGCRGHGDQGLPARESTEDFGDGGCHVVDIAAIERCDANAAAADCVYPMLFAEAVDLIGRQA